MIGKRILTLAALAAMAVFAVHAGAAAKVKQGASGGATEHLRISGVYPHLTVYNFLASGEVGIGAVVPWAGKLWMVTYTQHAPRGSKDKLYALDPQLNLEIRPESVGGTPAGRLIHKESNQLFIGHHAVDAQGKVRTIDIKKMPIRVAAIARHLLDPTGKVLYQDMEGPIYEVDVRTLEPKLLFAKPVPGWHGKGCYTGQGRFIIANNGEGKPGGGHSYNTILTGGPPQGPEDSGALAEWDGKTWKVIERRQFCDVTGPGGIEGNPDDKAPVWAIGWDKRSVLLKLCDGGKWYTFRLPKANHTYDAKHGYFTEWPRIRAITEGKMMMDMDGMFFDFPKTFSAANTAGIAPLSSHLRYVPDFCDWNGQLILATDETTRMDNPLVGQCQSNLWFGTLADLKEWGPRQGWGGVWINDPVKAGVASDPFLINGFDRKVVHLANGGDAAVKITLEIDAEGNGKWAPYKTYAVPASGYRWEILPADFKAQWVRATADRDTVATAFFYYGTTGHDPAAGKAMFASLADAGDKGAVNGGLIRPGKETRNLLYVAQTAGQDGQVTESYNEVDEKLRFSTPAEDKTAVVKQICKITKDFETDEASVILTRKGNRYRLPKGDPAFDRPFATGWPRGFREVESERTMINVHGTFYLLPRDAELPIGGNGVALIQPVCTHNRQIMDYCTWRGLLVLSGNKKDAKVDGHTFGSKDIGLWFGAIDDMWKLGKPVGKGGPWNGAAVKAGAPSDPYLMTGYDKKTVELSHDAAGPVTITVEVDVDHSGKFHEYRRFRVPAGRTIKHVFPAGYNAHWVRAVADKDCQARVMFVYE